jgi:hypothetical protein
MYVSVVTLLNIGKNLIPCVWMIGIVHVQDMKDHPLDELGLAIHLWVEGSGFVDIGVQSVTKISTRMC